MRGSFKGMVGRLMLEGTGSGGWGTVIGRGR
jgi:hypothetical protein